MAPEAFDDIAHGPLAVFVGSIGGEEAFQPLIGEAIKGNRPRCKGTRDLRIRSSVL